MRYGDTQLLAGLLHHRRPRRVIAQAAGEYQAELARPVITDDAVARRGRPRLRREAHSRTRDLLISAVLLPYALIGAVIGLVPWLLVQAVRLLPAAPAVKATITPGVAALAFGIEWLTTSWGVRPQQGPRAGATAFLLIPFFLAATVFVAERLNLWWRRRRVGTGLPRMCSGAARAASQRTGGLIWSRL